MLHKKAYRLMRFFAFGGILLENEMGLFMQLEKMTSQSGYINTLSMLYLVNNYMKFDSKKNKKLEDVYLSHQNSPDYLMRNELAVLYNLMCKNPLTLEFEQDINYNLQYERSLNLCDEIHKKLAEGFLKKEDDKSGQWRETFFYGSENAHTCQIIDFFEYKYLNDNDWLVQNRGFSVGDALKIAQVINGLFRLRIINEQELLKKLVISNDLYKHFIFDVEQIEFHSGVNKKNCLSFLEALSNKSDIEKYQKIDEFNICKAYPFLKVSGNKYFLPSFHMLLEAMYETPYYWMIDDENYNREFSKNRGAFAEDFCEKVIGKVFGEENVYKNIEIYKGKKRLGEIDILVVWGEIILIVEIKSKRLSLKAKQGDVEYIENDFNLSVRKAYEQLVKCSSILIHDNVKLKYKNKFLELKSEIKKIYPICLISESYPSLNFQVKDFFKKD
jgi:Holliday junction resolvase-like predicted endonuclease